MQKLLNEKIYFSYLGRDRDWVCGLEVDELLFCDPQIIQGFPLTCQVWAIFNDAKSTAINNAGDNKEKALQFINRTLYKYNILLNSFCTRLSSHYIPHL